MLHTGGSWSPRQPASKAMCLPCDTVQAACATTSHSACPIAAPPCISAQPGGISSCQSLLLRHHAKQHCHAASPAPPLAPRAAGKTTHDMLGSRPSPDAALACHGSPFTRSDAHRAVSVAVQHTAWLMHTHLFLASHHHLEGPHCCPSLGLIHLGRGVQALQHIKGLRQSDTANSSSATIMQ